MDETPSKLLFGVEQAAKSNDCMRTILEDLIVNDNRDIVALREKAAENIIKIQVANQKAYNIKRKAARSNDVGD